MKSKNASVLAVFLLMTSFGGLAETKALADDAELTGTVVDDAGQPVAGATVLTWPKNRRATTDAAGKFVINKIVAGDYRLYIRKSNLVAKATGIRPLDSGDAGEIRFDPVTVTLRPGKQIRVTVVSQETNEPIASAPVQMGFPFRQKAETSADGTVTIRGLLPTKCEIRASAIGHAKVFRDLDLSHEGAATEITLKLPAGGTISGRVTDGKGNPVPGASVVYRVPNVSFGFYGESPDSDENGEFRNVHLPLGMPIEISANKRGHSEFEQQITLTAEKRQREIHITLAEKPPGGSVIGVVRDESGKPIAGAKLTNNGENRDEQRQATSDAEGRFRLDKLYKSYAGVELVVEAKGFASVRKAVDPGTAESPTEVNVVMPIGHTVRGRLLNKDKEPISGGLVSCRGAVSSRPIGPYARTGKDGIFQFDSLPLECKFRLEASGYSTIHDVKLDMDTEQPIDIVLAPMGLIRGQVLDKTSGEPIKAFLVQLSFSEVRKPGDVRGSYPANLSEPGTTISSPSGEFRIAELTHQMPFEVTITAEDYEKHVIPRVVASNDPDAERIDVELSKFDPRKQFTVTGQIVDFEGRPVSDVELRLIVTSQPVGENNEFNWLLVMSGQLARRGRCDQFLTGVTDSKGNFEFANVLPKKFLQLAVWSDKMPRGRFFFDDQTEPGATVKMIGNLPEPAMIKGSIDMSKYPDAGAIVISIDEQAFHQYEFPLSKDTKQYEFTNLPPGSYSICVQSIPQRKDEDSYTLYPIAREAERLCG